MDTAPTECRRATNNLREVCANHQKYNITATAGAAVPNSYDSLDHEAHDLRLSVAPEQLEKNPTGELSGGDGASGDAWAELVALIEPRYPKSGQWARPPMPLESMLRI